MALNRRRFTRDFTLQVIRAVEAGKTVAQAAREHQLHPTLIRRWQHEHRQNTDHVFMGNGHLDTYEARIAELERLIGQLTMGNALLKTALLRLEARPRGPSRPGGRCWMSWLPPQHRRTLRSPSRGGAGYSP